jgi:threonine aldolase
MRQAGVIAAAGIVALDSMVDRLQEDHDRANAIGKGKECVTVTMKESTSEASGCLASEDITYLSWSHMVH